MVAAVEIIDAFLDWAQKNRERLTYEAYQRRLQAFVDSIPPGLPYTELKPYHVTRVMDANASKWNNNSKNDFASAVQRAFNWAQAEGMISHNPLARIRKPGREARRTGDQPGPVCRNHAGRHRAEFPHAAGAGVGDRIKAAGASRH